MIEPFLESQLEPIATRYRRLQLLRALALCWAGAAVLAVGFLALEQITGLSSVWRIPALIVLALAAGFFGWRRTRKWKPDFRQIARRIENEHPELRSLLITA